MQNGRTSPSSTLLYSLAEHVQLRNDGWWEKAIDRTLLWNLYESGQGLTQHGAKAKVIAILGITTDGHIVDRRIKALSESGSVVDTGTGIYLSEVERQRLDLERVSAEAINAVCQDRFKAVSRKHAMDMVLTWDDFVRKLIVPVTKELGSRTFELLRGDTPVRGTEAAAEFLNGFDSADREAMQDLTVEYLDPDIPEVRQHVLGYLTNYTLLSAGGLTTSQLDALAPHDSSTAFDAILDTNAIFSILGLHKNPQNESASALLQLPHHLSASVTLKFWVLASTLDEAIQSLEGAQRVSPGLTVPNVLLEAGVRYGHITGLVQGFSDARVESRLLSPESYFGPYINGLAAILGQRGVGIIDDSELDGSTRVRDRTDNWMTYEPGAGRGKSRTQLEHDVRALEMVRLKRGSDVHEVLKADWWFVTLDLRLQDRERRDLAGSKRLASAINAADFVQLLRFWVPRSEQMEAALIGAIRMPFTFYSYDRAIEQSSLRILAVLAGIERVDELTPEAAALVFQDGSLREQLSGVPRKSAEEAHVVADSLRRADIQFAPLAAELEAKLAEANAKLAAQQESSSGRDVVQGGRDRSKRDLTAQRDRATRQNDKSARREKDLQSANVSLKLANDKLTQENARRDTRVQQRAERTASVWVTGLVGGTAAAVAGLVVVQIASSGAAWVTAPWVMIFAGVAAVVAMLAALRQFIPGTVLDWLAPVRARWARALENKYRKDLGLEPRALD